MKTENCPRCGDGVLVLGGVGAAPGVSMPCPYCDAWEAMGKPPEGRVGAWKACQSFRAWEIVISNAERLLASFAEGKSDLYRLGIAVDGKVRVDMLGAEAPPWLAERGRVFELAGFGKAQGESW